MAITPLPTPPSRADAANFSTRADAFLGALPTFATEANALATQVSSDATTAQTAAATAVASPNTIATSTTSLAIGTGSKGFVTQSGKTFTSSMWIAAINTADGNTWMAGPISSYSGTNLTVDVQRTSGSGTVASWEIYAINPMLLDSVIRNLAAGSTIKDAGGTDRLIGYLGAPPISITTATTLALSHVGRTLEIFAGGSLVVPLHAAVAFNPGDIILVREMSGATKSVTVASGVTFRMSGGTGIGNRTLKAYGEGAIKFTSVNDTVYCQGDFT